MWLFVMLFGLFGIYAKGTQLAARPSQEADTITSLREVSAQLTGIERRMTTLETGGNKNF